MKKLLSMVLVLMISLSMVACSSSNENTGMDKEFISDVKKSTTARWKYVDDVDEGKIKAESESKYLAECVKIEKDILSKYKDAEFNSPELGKLAKDYLNALDKQENAVKYYNGDYLKHEKLWGEGYNERSTILVTLIDKFGLEVEKSQFEEMKNNAKVVEEDKKIEDEVNNMLKTVDFKIVKNEYGWKYYETIVENTTDVSFEHFWLNIDMIDADGVVVESTQEASHNGVWKPGQKYKFTFSTDVKFEKMEWSAEYYILY